MLHVKRTYLSNGVKIGAKMEALNKLLVELFNTSEVHLRLLTRMESAFLSELQHMVLWIMVLRSASRDWF